MERILSSSLRAFGRKLDGYFRKIPIPVSSETEQKNVGELKYTGCARAKIKALNATIATFYLINFFSNTISTYQGLNALGAQAAADGSIIKANLYNFAKIAQILMGSISGVSFGAGFMVKISQQLKERYIGSPEENQRKAEVKLVSSEQKSSDSYTEEDAKKDVILDVRESDEAPQTTAQSPRRDSLPAVSPRGFGIFAAPTTSQQEESTLAPWVIQIKNV